MMKALALALALSVAAAPPTNTSSATPGLRTPLERELWRALVLLEGDVETATRALESCELALDETAAPLPSPATAPEVSWDWVWPVVGAALAFGSGLAVGLLLDAPAGP